MPEKKRRAILKVRAVREGIFFLLCAASLLIYSLVSHYSGVPVEWKMSPYLFPILTASLLFILSGIVLLQGIREYRKSTGEERTEYFHAKSFLAVLAIVLAYCLAVKTVTFLAATPLLLLAMLLALGERRRAVLILVPVLTTGSVYMIFGVLLRINLP